MKLTSSLFGQQCDKWCTFERDGVTYASVLLAFYYTVQYIYFPIYDVMKIRIGIFDIFFSCFIYWACLFIVILKLLPFLDCPNCFYIYRAEIRRKRSTFKFQTGLLTSVYFVNRLTYMRQNDLWNIALNKVVPRFKDYALHTSFFFVCSHNSVWIKTNDESTKKNNGNEICVRLNILVFDYGIKNLINMKALGLIKLS